MQYISILIFIMLLVMYLLYNKSNIEPYDAVLINTDLPSCADKCKITEGCNGIGHNSFDNTCYMSNTGLFDINENNSKYINEYNTDHVICNKLSPIQSIENSITRDEITNNATYNCLETPGEPTKMYLSRNENTFESVKNLDALFKLNSINPYKIYQFDWDKEIYPIAQYVDRELVYKLLLDTDQNKVLKAKSIIVNNKEDHAYERSMVNNDYTKYDDFNLGEYLTNTGVSSKCNIKQDTMNGKPQYQAKDGVAHVSSKCHTVQDMMNSINASTGTKLSSQCMIDTDLTSCMMICNSRDDCIGFEHAEEKIITDKSHNVSDVNFSYTGERVFKEPVLYNETVKYKNLCCMKQTLGPFTPRKDKYKEFENGRFYLKNIYVQ
jgi:hypothetical protein